MKTTIKKGNSSLTSRFAIGKLVLTAYSKYIVILMHENFIAFERTREKSVEVLGKIILNTGYKRKKSVYLIPKNPIIVKQKLIITW